MKILTLTKYPIKGPSSRYRFHQFQAALEKEGVQLHYSSFFSQHYLEKLFGGQSVIAVYLVGRCLLRMTRCLFSKHFDAVWIEGELLPFFPAWAERLLHCFLPSKRYYDFDDAVWLRYQDKPRLAGKYLAILADAEAVMVGNEYLASYVQQASPRTIYLPTVIEKTKYQTKKAPLQGKVIGWIGSPTTVFFLETIKPVFETLATEIDFELHLVGAQLDWPGVKVVCHPWDEASEVDLIAGFDIGIMPLDDSDWARGKCGLKLIQYLATGVPAIASPVGVNADIINDSGGGFLATNASDWHQNISSLLKDQTLRTEMGLQGRAWALSKMTISAHLHSLTDVFKEKKSASP